MIKRAISSKVLQLAGQNKIDIIIGRGVKTVQVDIKSGIPVNILFYTCVLTFEKNLCILL